MTDRRRLPRESLAELVRKLIGANLEVYGPKRTGDRTDFGLVRSAAEMDDAYLQTDQSPKFLLFPKAEALFRFRAEGEVMSIRDRNLDPEGTQGKVLLGVHPCDAAAIGRLKALFLADAPDPLFARRLDRLTVIGLGCSRADGDCFCTSVGGGPGDPKGSDILLTRLADGDFLAEILSEKGEKIVHLAPGLFRTASAEEKESCLAKFGSPLFAPEELSARLKALFGREDFWVEQSLRCIGCGACAFVCPVCACFDVQDEGSREAGVRLRCWDSCGFSHFTLHSSGHNPRELQSQRWRQRMMHKFSYMHEIHGLPGCVGCGRCSRACPADIRLLEQLEVVMEEKP
jgi:sulfhydrogenase subunit beta (sulfur reductase)